MTDELLPYYNRELAFFRKLGAEFADANPKIAQRLRLGADVAEDPHVERMIEAFAYLNARVRHKLEDDFPEVTDALLGVLYPHYQRPIPASSIIQFILDRSQGELTTGYKVPVHSEIETESIAGQPCRFRTCYPTTLWPIELVEAKIQRPPFSAPTTRASTKAKSLLQLKFSCLAKEMTFKDLKMDSLRFYLKGQSQYIFTLYELLFNNVLEVTYAGSYRDQTPYSIGPETVGQVGFKADEGMLPYSAQSFLGYRLISEFFAFPEKFLFFDLNNIKPSRVDEAGHEFEIYIFFDRFVSELEQNVSDETLRLGCTPMINLYRKRAEPIQLSQTEHEYRVVPDARRPMATEVYSINSVTASSPEGDESTFQPFYSCKHGQTQDDMDTLWFGSRRPSERDGEEIDEGTEVYLSLVDMNFDPSVPAEWTVHVDTLCLNRDLPEQLPFGGTQPHLNLVAGGPISSIRCLNAPTRTLRPPLKNMARWRLISHLSLNHLSIVDNDLGAHALQEVLTLYDFTESDEIRTMIEGISKVSSRRVVGRAGGLVSGGLCRGVEIALELDENRFTGSGLYLFASVLEHFFGLYSSINSFSQTVVSRKGRQGVLRRWPPRAGERVLL